MNARLRIGIVAVALNERKALEVTSHQVRDTMRETGLDWCAVFVDGNSIDGSVEYLQANGFDVIVQSKPGLPAALNEGINWVKQKSCDIVVMFQPDGNCDARKLPELILPLVDSDIDLVIGSRYLNMSRSADDNTITWVGNLLFRVLVRLRFPRSRLRDPIVGYRAFRTSLLGDLGLDRSEQYSLLARVLKASLGFDPLLTTRVLRSNRSILEVDAPEPPRIGGIPKRQTLRWGIAYALQILFDSFLYTPNGSPKTRSSNSSPY